MTPFWGGFFGPGSPLFWGGAPTLFWWGFTKRLFPSQFFGFSWPKRGGEGGGGVGQTYPRILFWFPPLGPWVPGGPWFPMFGISTLGRRIPRGISGGQVYFWTNSGPFWGFPF
eukprot:FR743519.1.p1 GENE.FR743519.1~~FR743519.1.p1  ORF type:complete len:113 (-),score=49.46 FR743519.1:668-1006(-)